MLTKQLGKVHAAQKMSEDAEQTCQGAWQTTFNFSAVETREKLILETTTRLFEQTDIPFLEQEPWLELGGSTFSICVNSTDPVFGSETSFERCRTKSPAKTQKPQHEAKQISPDYVNNFKKHVDKVEREYGPKPLVDFSPGGLSCKLCPNADLKNLCFQGKQLNDSILCRFHSGNYHGFCDCASCELTRKAENVVCGRCLKEGTFGEMHEKGRNPNFTAGGACCEGDKYTACTCKKLFLTGKSLCRCGHSVYAHPGFSPSDRCQYHPGRIMCEASRIQGKQGQIWCEPSQNPRNNKWTCCNKETSAPGCASQSSHFLMYLSEKNLSKSGFWG
jgi:hypothetical protein